MWRYFEKSEFKCPCCGANYIEDNLIDRLDMLRSKLLRPLIVNSGYRCRYHNHEIKGAPNSLHLVGKAADINVEGFEPFQKYEMIQYAMMLGFRGIGVAEVFVHLDMRDRKSLWTY